MGKSVYQIVAQPRWQEQFIWVRCWGSVHGDTVVQWTPKRMEEKTVKIWQRKRD